MEISRFDWYCVNPGARARVRIWRAENSEEMQGEGDICFLLFLFSSLSFIRRQQVLIPRLARVYQDRRFKFIPVAPLALQLAHCGRASSAEQLAAIYRDIGQSLQSLEYRCPRFPGFPSVRTFLAASQSFLGPSLGREGVRDFRPTFGRFRAESRASILPKSYSAITDSIMPRYARATDSTTIRQIFNCSNARQCICSIRAPGVSCDLSACVYINLHVVCATPILCLLRQLAI